jgi:7-carboxy-7-deazaguanine synthase
MSRAVERAIATPSKSTQSSERPTPTAALVEVFSAIQGEGLNVGTRQLFVRLGGCDLRCHYCDSAHTWHAQDTCRVEVTPGQRDFEVHNNPVSISQLIGWVMRQNIHSLHDSLSLTGGEPLLQADFLTAFLNQLRHSTQIPIYLETGGHHPEELKRLLPFLDMVGMDIKLPSVSGETHWKAHEAFLSLCHQSSSVTVFCKVIVSRATAEADLDQAMALIAGVNSRIPVFVQPVTPLSAKGQPISPTPAQVLDWQAKLKQQLTSVRVIPQTHKMIDQL